MVRAYGIHYILATVLVSHENDIFSVLEPVVEIPVLDILGKNTEFPIHITASEIHPVGIQIIIVAEKSGFIL